MDMAPLMTVVGNNIFTRGGAVTSSRDVATSEQSFCRHEIALIWYLPGFVMAKLVR